jgi:methane/ammonia monooxygenase subunit C
VWTSGTAPTCSSARRPAEGERPASVGRPARARALTTPKSPEAGPRKAGPGRAQMPALIPKEVEIQRLKKIYIMVIMLGSIAASVEVDNFVDGSLHQTAIRDSAFTPAHWWLYSHFIALPLGWGFVAMYDRRVPILRGPNNSMNTGLKITIIGYLATMFTIGINELWHFWFVEEIFSVPNHWMFNMGVVVAFMGALAYVVRVYARLVELGAETPARNPYVAEMYKLALEGKLYSRSIP